MRSHRVLPRRSALLIAAALAAVITIAYALTVNARGVTGPAGVSPYGPPLHLTLSTRHLGYVSASLTGPADTHVTLSEHAGRTNTTAATVELSGRGIGVIPRAATWLCDPRTLMFTARVASASGASAAATVTTPSCQRRFRLSAAGHVRVGRAITAVIHDLWGVGGVPLTVCVTAPGGTSACARASLKAGTRTLTKWIPAPRPGGWLVSLTSAGGGSAHETVWAEHPGGGIQVLAAGDSEMQGLDNDIAQDLAAYQAHVSSDARPSTGLENEWFFNWHHEAALDAATIRPDVTVIYMGANGGFAINTAGGHQVSCCGAQWSALYARPVAQLTRTLLRGSSGRVYWYVMPTPRSASWQMVFDGVNTGIREAVAQFPGRAALIDLNAVLTPGNHYRDYTTYDGHGFVIHTADGVHVTPAADTVAARLFVNQLRADRIIP